VGIEAFSVLSDIVVLCIALTTDRQTDRSSSRAVRRIGPRDEVFFHPGTPRSRLSAGLNEPDPENIISNPSEGKIYESSSLRIVLEHCGACNRLAGKSTPFSAGFPFMSFIKDERACSCIKGDSRMYHYTVDVGFTWMLNSE